MKIENINEDIIKDTIELRNEVEQTIIDEKPHLDFTLCLPGIEEMSAIKLIELDIHENEQVHAIRAEIHTHNGHRVFESNFRQLSQAASKQRHPLHDWFFTLLREVIKRRKVRVSRAHKLLCFKTI